MAFFQFLFIALTVFGAGVTAVDLFGAFEHAGPEGDHSGGHDAGHGSGHDASHDAVADHGSGQDMVHGAAADHLGGHDAVHGHLDAGHDLAQGSGHDPAHAAAHVHGQGQESRGSLLETGNRRVRAVGKAISALRSFVYFSLGAGPMGWIALARKEGLVESLLWAAISGFLIAVMARMLRRFLRRDLDSSLKDGDFVMEPGVVTVSIAPGEMGKVRVRKFGAETELYARMKSGGAEKGELVRIVDYDNECYYAEKETGLGVLPPPGEQLPEKK